MDEESYETLHRVETDIGHTYEFSELDTCAPLEEPPVALSDNQYHALRRFLSCHPDFVYFFDQDHRFTYVSPPLLQLWGLTLEEAVGKSFEELGYPEELCELHATQLDLAFSGKTVQGENAYTSPDGVTGYYEYIFVPLGDAEGTVSTVAGVTRDVSRRKRLEKERELLQSAIVHDLRAPLGVVELCAEVLEATLGEDETARAVSERLRRNARRASRMVAALLDVATIRAGEGFELERRPLRIDEVVVESARQIAELRRGELVIEVSPTGEAAGEAFSGRWDEEAAARIVENLVENAFKYGSEREPVCLRVRRAEARVVIEVRNEGSFIPPKEQEELFRLFTRGRDRDQRNPGWGIGLTVVAALAEAHGGSVTLESTRDEGTTFSVSLPVLPPAPAAG